MKAELIIPEGYKKVTQGFVEKEDLVFSAGDMTWVKACYMCKVSDCYFVIRKVDAE